MAEPIEFVQVDQVDAQVGRAERFRAEQLCLAEADADYQTGRFIEGEELELWLAWLTSDAPDSDEPGKR